MAYLFLLASEVVSGLLLASDSILQVCITAIVGCENGVLVALRVMDVETDSTVLATICNLGSGANGGYIVAEEKGEDFLARVGRVSDGAIWAAGAGVGEFADVDIVGIWEHWRSRRSWSCKAESGSGGEKCGCEEHICWLRLVARKAVRFGLLSKSVEGEGDVVDDGD